MRFPLNAAAALLALLALFAAGAFAAPAAISTAARLAALDATSAPGRVVFLGASSFAGLDVQAVSPRGLNLSIPGETIAGLRQRLPGYRSVAQARALVVHIGFNDVMQGCAAVETAAWNALLQQLPATVPALLLGLQGVGETPARRDCGGRIAALLASSNQALQAACAQRAGCEFVAHPVPALGPQPAGLQAADGIHPSAAGYARLLLVLRGARSLATTGADQP